MSDEVTYLKHRVSELEQLNSLAGALSSTMDVNEILKVISGSIQKLCRAEFVTILLLDPQSKEVVRTLVRTQNSSGGGIEHPLNELIAGWVLKHNKTFETDDVLEFFNYKNPGNRLPRPAAALGAPLVTEDATIGVLNLVNLKGGEIFSGDSIRTLSTIASMSARFIHRANLHRTLFEDNMRLKKEIERKYGQRAIIGESPVIKDMIKKLSMVSQSASTVLLVGETGTGKEQAAQSIHFQGARADKPF